MLEVSESRWGCISSPNTALQFTATGTCQSLGLCLYSWTVCLNVKFLHLFVHPVLETMEDSHLLTTGMEITLQHILGVQQCQHNRLFLRSIQEKGNQSTDYYPSSCEQVLCLDNLGQSKQPLGNKKKSVQQSRHMPFSFIIKQDSFPLSFVTERSLCWQPCLPLGTGLC